MPRLTTAVIGAGPAGLLFCVIGRLLAERAGVADAWTIRLFDKRAAYARTHRLRMDPAPYRAIQRDVADPRFDELMVFLEECSFAPEVNLLEERLSALLAELGLQKELFEATGDVGELRALVAADPVTIVAADSVHSVVREAVRGRLAPQRSTHEQVARVRVIGDGLDERLGLVDQFRLSKVLGSVVDYRLNRNGFAEVDLFLTPAEHRAVRELGATPREPVRITATMLGRLRAPLFRAIVEHLEREGREVLLQSTFELEHTVMQRLTFAVEDAPVFLLGDAAISLPFFRGMACLAECAHSLARAHVDHLSRPDEALAEALLGTADQAHRFGARVMPGRIVAARATVHHGHPAVVVLHRFASRYGVHVLHRDGDDLRVVHSHAPIHRALAQTEFAALSEPLQRYELETLAIKRRELAVVQTRALLVRVLRELVRVSSLLPFPIQSWWLSARPSEKGSERWSLGLFGNLALALAALAATTVSLAVAIALQMAGGVAYHAVLAFERGPHRHVRRIWEVQIALAFGLGVAIAAKHPGWGTKLLAATWWLQLGLAFVYGLYVFERLLSASFSRAALGEHD